MSSDEEKNDATTTDIHAEDANESVVPSDVVGRVVLNEDDQESDSVLEAGTVSDGVPPSSNEVVANGADASSDEDGVVANGNKDAPPGFTSGKDVDKTAATPVASRQPSSASSTQQPEFAPEPDRSDVDLHDAVRKMLDLVESHRTIGDSDLAAAVADVEAALDKQ